MRSPDSRTLGNAPPARHELGRRREEPVGRTMAPLSRDLGLGSGGGGFCCKSLAEGGSQEEGAEEGSRWAGGKI